MKTLKIIGLIILGLIFALIIYHFFTPGIALNSIQSSHIEANVPNEIEFNNLLKRDIAQYFRAKGINKFEITLDLLRKGPTQSGVAYPKFYLWVKLMNNNNVLSEGAIRVAAIDRTRFEVTNYLTKQDIKSNKDTVFTIFPRALCGNIINRANN
jgi:hypothetical protein